MEGVRLLGKTVIITGANTGIGKETARELARRGGRVILACRDPERAQAAREEIVRDTKNENVVVKTLDLASLRSVQQFADDINQNEQRLDILVNNAGVFTRRRETTQDGFEMMFGVNHLGHFHLTNLLLPKLRASAPSRVVLVSSKGHRFSAVKLDDLQYEQGFSAVYGYSRTKTANILHGVQLAKELQGTGVSVYSLHPGVVRTELPRHFGWLASLFWVYIWIRGEKILTPADGAKTTLYCCLEPSVEGHSGRYYSDCGEAKAASYAMDPDIAKKLWELSTELIQSKI